MLDKSMLDKSMLDKSGKPEILGNGATGAGIGAGSTLGSGAGGGAIGVNPCCCTNRFISANPGI
jgi:hypothetical protein